MKRVLAWYLGIVMVFTMALTDFGSFARADEVPQEETQTAAAETEEVEEPEMITPEETEGEENPEPAAKEREELPEEREKGNAQRAATEEKAEPAHEEEHEELTEACSAGEGKPADGTTDVMETEEETSALEPNDGTEAEEKKAEASETPETEPEDGKTGSSAEATEKEEPGITEEPIVPSQEGTGFQAGYVKIKSGAELYKDTFCSHLLGTLQEDAVAYAVELNEQSGSVSLVLSVEGNAVFAWLYEENAEVLTEAEAEQQEKRPEDLFWAGKARLMNAYLELEGKVSAQTEAQEEGNPETEVSSEENSENPGLTEAQEENGEQPKAETAAEAHDQEETNGSEEEEEASEPVDEKEDIGTGVIYGEGGFLIPEIRPVSGWNGEAPVAKDYVSPPAEFMFYSISGEIYPLWKGTAGCYYEMQKKENNGDWTVLNQYMYCEKDGYYYYPDGKTLGRTYQYRIRTFDSSYTSHSAWVYISVFYTDSISASAKVNSKTAVPVVKWTKAKGATGYYIYRKVTNRYNGKSTKWKLVKKIFGNKNFSYADKSIAINRHYDYEIVPVRQAGKKIIAAYSDYTGKTSANVRPLSGVPQNVNVKQVSNGVRITWEKVTGATGYTIYYTNNPYSEKPVWRKLVTTKKLAYTHKDKIKPGTSGKYRRYRIYPTAVINGKTKKGLSAYTDIIKRLARTTVKLSKGSAEDTVVVRWKKVKGANLYRIYYKLAGEDRYRYGQVSGNYTSALLTGAHNITGTKKNLIYVVPVSTSNKTGKTQVGSKSVTKSITPYWYRVLISYNDYYPSMSYTSNLANIGKEKDMKGLKKVFSNQSVKLKTVRNASRSDLTSAISSTFGGATKNTVCIFCFTGHGVSARGYSTGGLGYPYFTLLPSELKSLLDSYVPSEHVVLLISACGSGGLIKGDVSAEEEVLTAYTNAWIRTFQEDEAKHGELASGKRYSVMTSADLYHNSFSTYNRYTKIGLFSYFMLGVCRGGGYDFNTGSKTGLLADKNKNGKVTFSELFSYVRNYAKNSTKNANGGPQVAQKYTKEPNLIIFP